MVVPQVCPTRVFRKRVPKECPTRVSAYKTVSREWPTGVTNKSVCPARVSHKNVLQECPARVSYKSGPQECPTRVVRKSVPEERVSKSVPQKCFLQGCHKLLECFAFEYEYVFAFGFVGSILLFFCYF